MAASRAIRFSSELMILAWKLFLRLWFRGDTDFVVPSGKKKTIVDPPFAVGLPRKRFVLFFFSRFRSTVVHERSQMLTGLNINESREQKRKSIRL